MHKSLAKPLVAAALSLLASGTAWSLTTASVTTGPVVLSFVDLAPDDGHAAGATLNWNDLYGYADHESNGGPYVETTPFTAAPGVALLSGAAHAARAEAAHDGVMSTQALLQSGGSGYTGAYLLDAAEITIEAHTQVTLQFAVDVSAYSNAAPGAWMNGAMAFADLLLDVNGLSFLDRIDTFVFGAGTGQKSGTARVTFSTGSSRVTGEVYRMIGANAFDMGAVTTAVPEPGTYALMLGGLLAVGIGSRRAGRRVIPANAGIHEDRCASRASQRSLG